MVLVVRVGLKHTARTIDDMAIPLFSRNPSMIPLFAPARREPDGERARRGGMPGSADRRDGGGEDAPPRTRCVSRRAFAQLVAGAAFEGSPVVALRAVPHRVFGRSLEWLLWQSVHVAGFSSCYSPAGRSWGFTVVPLSSVSAVESAVPASPCPRACRGTTARGRVHRDHRGLRGRLVAELHVGVRGRELALVGVALGARDALGLVGRRLRAGGVGRRLGLARVAHRAKSDSSSSSRAGRPWPTRRAGAGAGSPPPSARTRPGRRFPPSARSPRASTSRP